MSSARTPPLPVDAALETILRAMRPLGAERVALSGRRRDPQHTDVINECLDGQQRLSSICGAMFWKQDDKDSRWNIAYNLRDNEFTHLERWDGPALG